jgi:hypothetical protein
MAGAPANFPDSPSVGEIFTDQGLDWQWDGVKWLAGALAGFAPVLNPAGGANNYAPMDSGALTGTYTLNGVAITTGGPYASLSSPIFVGVPTAPTANPGDSSAQIATTSFVTNAIAALNVSTTYAPIVNPSGGVNNYAPIANPQFTGVPIAPTASAGTSTLQIATTAFVTNAIHALSIVSSFNGRTGAVTMVASDVTGVGGVLDASPTGGPYGRYQQGWLNLATYFAPYVNPGAGQNNYAALASPTFTGTPTLPTGTIAVTQAAGTNNTTVATTAFVQAKFATGVTSWNGRTGAVTLTLSDVTGVGGAPISNPSFQGNVSATGGFYGAAVQSTGNITSTGGTVVGVNVQATSSVISDGGVYAGWAINSSNPLIMFIDSNDNRWISWASGWGEYWLASNGEHVWNNPSQAIMVLDGSGNLSISGSASMPGNCTVSGALITNNITCNVTLTVGNVNVTNEVTVGGPLYADGGIQTNGAGITCGVIYPSLVSAAGGASQVGTNLVTNGNVYIGGSSSGYVLQVDGSGNRNLIWDSNIGWYDQWAAASGIRYYISGDAANAWQDGGGDWHAHSFNVISDQRSKYGIKRDERGLEVIRKLLPKTFTRNAQPPKQKGPQIPAPRQQLGFVAQDILAVLPEAVKETQALDTNKIYGIDPVAILAALVNAVQELDRKVNS